MGGLNELNKNDKYSGEREDEKWDGLIMNVTPTQGCLITLIFYCQKVIHKVIHIFSTNCG